MEFPAFQFVPTTSSVNGHHWEKSCSMFLAPCCLPPLRNLSTFQWIISHSGYPHIQWIRSHWAFYSPSWTGLPAAVSIFLFQFVQPRVSPAIMPWFPACWAGQSLRGGDLWETACVPGLFQGCIAGCCSKQVPEEGKGFFLFSFLHFSASWWLQPPHSQPVLPHL